MEVTVIQSGPILEQALEFRSRIMYETFGLDPSIDIDAWDSQAWHVVAVKNHQVIGYYRAMEGQSIGFCTEIEFDLSGLNIPRQDILEIGRACTDQQHPTAILRLWKEIIALARRLGKRWIMGTASLKVSEFDVHHLNAMWTDKYRHIDIGRAAAKIPYKVPCVGTVQTPPSLIQAYESIGAYVVSDLGWDPRFQTADVVTVLDINNITDKWSKKMRK